MYRILMGTPVRYTSQFHQSLYILCGHFSNVCEVQKTNYDLLMVFLQKHFIRVGHRSKTKAGQKEFSLTLEEGQLLAENILC